MSRMGTFDNQYSIAVSSLSEAAVRSARPRNARMMAMKADASFGLSREVTCGYSNVREHTLEQ